MVRTVLEWDGGDKSQLKPQDSFWDLGYQLEKATQNNGTNRDTFEILFVVQEAIF